MKVQSVRNPVHAFATRFATRYREIFGLRRILGMTHSLNMIKIVTFLSD